METIIGGGVKIDGTYKHAVKLQLCFPVVMTTPVEHVFTKFKPMFLCVFIQSPLTIRKPKVLLTKYEVKQIYKTNCVILFDQPYDPYRSPTNRKGHQTNVLCMMTIALG